MLNKYSIVLGIFFILLTKIAFAQTSTQILQDIICCSMDWKEKRQLIINLVEHEEDPADPNAEDPGSGWTALDLAASYGDIDLIAFLVERGALSDRLNKDGLSPLMIAVKEGHIPVIEVLANLGADMHLSTKAGDNALTFAVDADNLDAIAELYHLGINLEPRKGPSVLLLAVHLQRLDALALLLAYMGPLSLGILDGEQYINILDLARLKNNNNLSLLLEHKGRFLDLLNYACLAKNAKLASLILKTKLLPSENILHAAVRSQSDEVLSLIIDDFQSQGLLAALVNQRNERGITALRLAGLNRSYEAAALLIKAGASPLLGPCAAKEFRLENPLHFGLGRFVQAVWPLMLQPNSRYQDNQMRELVVPQIPKELLALIGYFLVLSNLLDLAEEQ